MIEFEEYKVKLNNLKPQLETLKEGMKLEAAREEIKEAPKYDYVAVNETDRAEECARDILSIIRAEQMRSDRMMTYIHDYFDDDEI